MPQQREITNAALSRSNYRVTTVGSGEATVTHLGKRSMDLVLVEMIMGSGID